MLFGSLIFFFFFISGLCKQRKFSKKKSFFIGFCTGLFFMAVFFSIGISKMYTESMGFNWPRILETIGIGLVIAFALGIKCSTEID